MKNNLTIHASFEVIIMSILPSSSLFIKLYSKGGLTHSTNIENFYGEILNRHSFPNYLETFQEHDNQ